MVCFGRAGMAPATALDLGSGDPALRRFGDGAVGGFAGRGCCVTGGAGGRAGGGVRGRAGSWAIRRVVCDYGGGGAPWCAGDLVCGYVPEPNVFGRDAPGLGASPLAGLSWWKGRGVFGFVLGGLRNVYHDLGRKRRCA